MSAKNWTDYGGRRAGWPNTQGSLILRAQTQDTGRRKQAVGDVLEQYWKPVWCYLMARHRDYNMAMDRTQDFFCEMVLGKQLIRKYDPAKGRFRTFLLVAIRNYDNEQYRKKGAKKRAPDEQAISLEGAADAGLSLPAPDADPETNFQRGWASSVVHKGLDNLQEQLREDGRTDHWEMFSARVTEPRLQGTEKVPLKELCRIHNVASPGQITRIVQRVKKEFEEELRRIIAEYVTSEEEIDEEIRELMRILSE